MAATGSHNAGTSQSWISPAASTAARYARISTAASHLGLTRTSPFFPQNAAEYAVHVHETHDARLRRQRVRMQGRIAELGVKKRGGRPVTRGEDLRVRQFAFAGYNDGRTVPEHEQRLEDGGSASYSKFLGEKTAVWGGDEEHIVEGKKSAASIKMRAFWPDMVELKAEGEGRVMNREPRRFPLPRVDLYSDAVVRRLIPNPQDLTRAEMDALCSALAAKRDDIVWFERRAVCFHGNLDRLPAISRIFEEHEEMERYVARGRTDSGVSTSFEGDAPVRVMGGGGMGREPNYYGGQVQAPPGFEAAAGGPAADDDDLPSYLSALDIVNATRPRHTAIPPVGPETGTIERHAYYATDSTALAPPGGWKFDEGALRDEGWGGLLDELDCADENCHATY
ncbi:hypothetical protein B2J93_9314 [Marssonina coronariae]|uniref:Uncharacterized protein n=1 Tax=Diplocarpon coronariae TaxID=2795749 RepID=A0A218ZAQ5_9HELO|nr:hypothetical protein B2J93_9314 [Marssonina coronariae]